MDLALLSTTDSLECYTLPAGRTDLQYPDKNSSFLEEIRTIYEPDLDVVFEGGDELQDANDLLCTRSMTRDGSVAYSRLSRFNIKLWQLGGKYIKNTGSIYSIYNIGFFRLTDLPVPYLLVLNEQEGPIFFTDSAAGQVKDYMYNKLIDIARVNGYEYKLFHYVYPYSYFRGRHKQLSEINENFIMSKEYIIPDVPANSQGDVLNQVVEYLQAEMKEIMQQVNDYKRVSQNVNKSYLRVTVYDFMFQQLDMILTLIVRNIQLPKPIQRVSLHYLFIRHMYLSDSFGAYVRRPISLHMNSLDGMQKQWDHFMNPKNLYHYQGFRNYLINDQFLPLHLFGEERPKHLEHILDYAEFSKLETISKPMNDIKESRKRLSLTLPNITFTLPNMDTVYVPTLRDERLRNEHLTHWNLERWYAPYVKDEVAKMGESRTINSKVYYRNDFEKLGIMSARFEGDTIYQNVEEEPAHRVSLPIDIVKINGVGFRFQDLKLLYNTHLLNSIEFTGESDFTLPAITYKDLKLLRDVFRGRISLLYLYENISKYLYIQISGERTMIDIFEFIPVRFLILKNYKIGLPLAEQLSRVKYEGLGEIGRLDELIAIAKS